MLTWLLAAVATTAVYFYHYDFAATGSGVPGGKGYVLAHPLLGVQFSSLQLATSRGERFPIHS